MDTIAMSENEIFKINVEVQDSTNKKDSSKEIIPGDGLPGKGPEA